MDDIAQASLSAESQHSNNTLLYHPIACVDDYALLKSDINSISAWVASNCMSFITSKCKFMEVSRKHRSLHQVV